MFYTDFFSEQFKPPTSWKPSDWDFCTDQLDIPSKEYLKPNRENLKNWFEDQLRIDHFWFDLDQKRKVLMYVNRANIREDIQLAKKNKFRRGIGVRIVLLFKGAEYSITPRNIYLGTDRKNTWDSFIERNRGIFEEIDLRLYMLWVKDLDIVPDDPYKRKAWSLAMLYALWKFINTPRRK